MSLSIFLKNCKDIITLLLSPLNGVFQPVECEDHNLRIINALPERIKGSSGQDVKNYDSPNNIDNIKTTIVHCINCKN